MYRLHGRLYLSTVPPLPSLVPQRLRASTAGHWYWCAEQSRHLALGLIEEEEVTEEKEVGTLLHEVLAQTMGKRFPWEDEFIEAIAKYQDPELGFVREVQHPVLKVPVKVTCHPDEFQVTIDKLVSLVQYKTTSLSQFMIERYKLCMARFQVQVECFVLDPILEKEGYVFNRGHAVSFLNKDSFTHIKSYSVDYYPNKVEQDLKTCLLGYWDLKIMAQYKPRSWKCDRCSKAHKELCQFAEKRNV